MSREGRQLSWGVARDLNKVAASIAVLSVLLYLPALRNGFVAWDDGYYVGFNVFIRSLDRTLLEEAFLKFYLANWHPLTWLSHAADYAIWQLNPVGHHLSSILLHGANTFFVVRLAHSLFEAAERHSLPAVVPPSGQPGRNVAAAAAAGILFAIHPVHVESVAWVSERKDVLFMAFYLAAMLSYVQFARTPSAAAASRLSHRWRQGAFLRMSLLYVLAVLSKPMAITLPAVLLVMDWYPLGRCRRARDWVSLLAEKVPLFIIAGGSAAVTMAAQSSEFAVNTLPADFRAIVAVESAALYLGKLLVPYPLLPFYPYPSTAGMLTPSFVLSAAALIVISTACIAVYRTSPFWLASWACFLITLLPVLGIVQVGSQAMADRYLYLPSLFFCILAGAMITRGWERLRQSARPDAGRMTGIVLGAAMVCALSWATVVQIAVWRDTVSLWSQVIRHDGTADKAYHHRGNAYRDLGQYDAALEDLNSAVRLNGQNANALNDRGIVLAKLGRLPEAVRDFTAAIRMNPMKAVYWRNRGNAYGEMGKYGEAEQDLRQADTVDHLAAARSRNGGRPYGSGR